MSETLDPVAMELDQRQLAEQLLAQAKEQGVELVGPNGLLNQLTKNVLETALDAEMAEHLGYDKHDPAGRGSGNSRNGTRAKTVLTEIGPVEIEVPRDTNSSFEPLSPCITGRRPRSADVASAWRSGDGRQDPAPNSGCVRALHRPGRKSRRAPHHDGAVVLAHRHAHNDDQACRSTGEHPPPAANTVRAAQDSLLLTNQERFAN
jgi:Transposase, Mutator family